MSENLLKVLLQKSFGKAQLSNKNKLHFRSHHCRLWEGAHHFPLRGQTEPVRFAINDSLGSHREVETIR